jgi:glycosyltransferase involved in cell wall biosynthesis
MAAGEKADPSLVKQVLISHSSVAPFVQQAARALLEAGRLDRFITTVRYDPSSTGQRWAAAAGRAMGFDLESQIRRRAVTELPPNKVESHPWWELARLAAGRLDKSGRLPDLVWERAEPALDRLVAGRLRPEHAAVYAFEFGGLASFRRARVLGARSIYDLPAPEPAFVRNLLEREFERFPELQTPYRQHTIAREERRLARRRAEWEAADIVIAASRFTRDTLAGAGLDAAKVRIVPYGAPPPAEREAALAGGSRPDEPLRFVWAGTFGIRKGAHYLIDAWREGGFGRRARLAVFGSVDLPERLLQPLPEGIEFGGALSREELMLRYRAGDALIFPTLCDGFGMVATEAWSQGLPVITTDRAGAADLLQRGRNGLLIRAGDRDAIAEAISWCLDHRVELRSMREAARSTAERWQWSDYRRALAAELESSGAFSS